MRHIGARCAAYVAYVGYPHGTAYQNAQKNSDKQNARIEHDKALGRVMTTVMKDSTELFKQFVDNPEFKRWLADMIFAATYERSSAA